MVQIESLEGNTIRMKVVDKLTHEDYTNVLIPGLEQILQNHDKVRVLVDVTEFKGWNLAAAWDDVTFGMKHRNDFEKFAVVGGKGWMNWGTKLGAQFMSGEVKTFSAEEREQAWEWIRE
ncbi:MAG: STAS/SEC14 domain-containing protein [Candidatus Hydrogenedentes bacterium]|nr:STAS/SEC14 domain-containing protein [Candidatus Hydrogenedentota bacterium]